jgi:hypothetical protein
MQLLIMMDREVSLSLDEAIETFDRISKPWMAVEESYDIDRENLGKFEQEIVLVERAVISENLFSENEDFEEVHEDYAR